MVRFPRATRVLLALLRPAVAPIPVRTLQPDLSETLPVVMARKVGGTLIDPRALESAVVDVQCWHGSDADAADLAETVRQALISAWRQQTVVDGLASIAAYTEQSSPALLPDTTTPKGVWRYQATYELALRPAR